MIWFLLPRSNTRPSNELDQIHRRAGDTLDRGVIGGQVTLKKGGRASAGAEVVDQGQRPQPVAGEVERSQLARPVAAMDQISREAVGLLSSRPEPNAQRLMVPRVGAHIGAQLRVMSVEDRRSFVHELAQRLPEPVIDYVRLQLSAVGAGGRSPGWRVSLAYCGSSAVSVGLKRRPRGPVGAGSSHQG